MLEQILIAKVFNFGGICSELAALKSGAGMVFMLAVFCYFLADFGRRAGDGHRIAALLRS
jgi:hypothetical protein